MRCGLRQSLATVRRPELRFSVGSTLQKFGPQEMLAADFKIATRRTN
jgi:hypothetical protein